MKKLFAVMAASAMLFGAVASAFADEKEQGHGTRPHPETPGFEVCSCGILTNRPWSETLDPETLEPEASDE